jgi:hypothetical protein
MATRLFLVGAFIVVLLGMTGTRFNIAEATGQGQTAQGTMQSDDSGMHHMMMMHQHMMAEMTAGDAKLDALVKEMNAAKGDAQLTALAALVSELVTQHKAMHSHMGEMHQHMMGMGGMATHR